MIHLDLTDEQAQAILDALTADISTIDAALDGIRESAPDMAPIYERRLAGAHAAYAPVHAAIAAP